MQKQGGFRGDSSSTERLTCKPKGKGYGAGQRGREGQQCLPNARHPMETGGDEPITVVQEGHFVLIFESSGE